MERGTWNTVALTIACFILGYFVAGPVLKSLSEPPEDTDIPAPGGLP